MREGERDGWMDGGREGYIVYASEAVREEGRVCVGGVCGCV